MDLSSPDIAVLDWLHHHLVPHSVPFLQGVSNSTTMISITMTVAVVVVSVIRRSRPLRMKFVTLVMLLLLVAGLSQGLKALIHRDRPFDSLSDIEKLSTGGDSSFPSGHTLEAFAMATALSLMFRQRRIILPVFAWALLVAYSRVALGVHYPSDVLAGMILGALSGWTAWYVLHKNLDTV
ncbi:MAG TPA: phosphatase PAP2 family protein [Bacteroidales bacterium]|nr:phosphatase PAP2 family protein [Bacteroidales bacterium]